MDYCKEKSQLHKCNLRWFLQEQKCGHLLSCLISSGAFLKSCQLPSLAIMTRYSTTQKCLPWCKLKPIKAETATCATELKCYKNPHISLLILWWYSTFLFTCWYKYLTHFDTSNVSKNSWSMVVLFASLSQMIEEAGINTVFI